MKVKVEKELCIGDGSCAEICPQIFELRGDGLAYVKNDADYSACESSLTQAVEGCPTGAIIFEE